MEAIMATRSGVKVTIQVEGAMVASASGINGAVASLAYRTEYAWAQGTSAGQVNLGFQDTLAVGTSPTDLDLDPGSNVTDPSTGSAQAFTKLHGLIVKNTHASQTLVVGGDAASILIFDAAADSITLQPGESVMWMAATGTDGRAITATTADIIQLTGSGADTTCEVTIWGR